MWNGSPFARPVRWVIVIHSLLVGSWVALTWNSDRTEIGPAWAYLFIFDYPCSLLFNAVLDAYLRSGAVALKNVYILGVAAAGTMHWVIVAFAITKLTLFMRSIALKRALQTGIPKMHRLSAILFLTTTCLCAGNTAHAQNWPRFRGPNGSGWSATTGLPVKWTDADYAWKVDLPGEGISSPVVWGNRLFITSADADAGKRWLSCYDAGTGKSLWSREYPFVPHKKHNTNSYATSTPAADDERVYTLWQSRESSALVALDHLGRDVWKHEFEPFQGGHGGGISPIVHEGLVIVANEQEGPSYVIALDAGTGEQKWRFERKTDRASYATPCVFERRDQPAQIILTEWKQGITSLDARTGRKNWEIGVFGDTTERAVSSPIVAGDLVIGTCGFVTGNKHTVALRPAAAGTDALPREVYRIERQVAYLPTSLAYIDWLFSWSEQGIVSCYKLTTGEQVWQKRVGGKFSSSPVCAGNVLYNVDETGTVIALSAGPEFQELGRTNLNDTCRSTPAIARGKLFLRTNSHLFAVGGGKSLQ